MEESKSFCMYPWTHLSLQADGSILSCCMAIGHPELGNLKEGSLSGTWNGPRMRGLRLKMLRGEKVAQCARCYDAEAAGGLSHRLEANRDFSDLRPRASQTSPEGALAEGVAPVFLELRFSNVCNFSCRTCGPEYSTAWQPDAVFLNAPPGMMKVLTPTDDPEALMDQLRPFLPGLRRVYLAGGEPLLAKEHYRFLDVLKEAGRTDVDLVYNTNFSVLEAFGRDVLRLWLDFKQVRLAASIDGMGPRGEYIRKGMKWETILTNRRRLAEACPHVGFSVFMTVSLLNVYHVPEFLEYCLETGFIGADGFHANLLEVPRFYNVKSLPRPFKDRVDALYQGFVSGYLGRRLPGGEGSALARELAAIRNYMFQEDLSDRLTWFFKMNGFYDRLRGESFAGLFPEYADLGGA